MNRRGRRAEKAGIAAAASCSREYAQLTATAETRASTSPIEILTQLPCGCLQGETGPERVAPRLLEAVSSRVWSGGKVAAVERDRGKRAGDDGNREQDPDVTGVEPVPEWIAGRVVVEG